MAKKSKKFRKNAERVGKDPVPLPNAVSLVKKFDGAKFDESVEVSLKLGIDPNNTTQGIRGAVSLPHGIGRQMRVVAFAEGAAAEAARAAGAIEVGSEDLAKKVLDGWVDFDVAIAHPAMMRHVGRLGRVLGPHGKMPTPKAGTVTESVGEAVAEFRAGKVEFRNDKGGNVHAVVGKKSFPAEKLVANIQAFIDHISTLRPPSAKGTFIQRVAISATMSPGVRVMI